jgi:hypothetical protein
MAALQRYDGVSFRVLRKWMQGRPGEHLSLIIISAKYGAIAGRTPIPYYDQQMTPERAGMLRGMFRSRLRAVSRHRRFKSVFVNVGRAYAGIIEGAPELAGALRATGGIGRRARMLKDWLHNC